MASDLEAPALLEHLHAMGRFDLSSMLTYERLRMATTIANLAREVERMRALLVRAVALIEQACQDSTCVDYEDPGCFFCGIPVGSTYVTFGEDDTETEHVHEHGKDCDAGPWLIDAGNALAAVAKLGEAQP